jgi:hypothetical protein
MVRQCLTEHCIAQVLNCMNLTLTLRWCHRRQLFYLTGQSCQSARSIEIFGKTERLEPEVLQVSLQTGLTLRNILASNHNAHGIVERKKDFDFVAIKNEGLRPCADELVKRIFLHRRAKIALTNCKLVLLNMLQVVFVRAAGRLGLGVLQARSGAHCHCQSDGIRVAVLMMLSAKMTLPAF